MPKADICARITTISAIEWLRNMEGCDERIDRFVWGKTVAVTVALAVFIIYHVVPLLLCLLRSRRTALHEVSCNLPRLPPSTTTFRRF